MSTKLCGTLGATLPCDSTLVPAGMQVPGGTQQPPQQNPSTTAPTIAPEASPPPKPPAKKTLPDYIPTNKTILTSYEEALAEFEKIVESNKKAKVAFLMNRFQFF